MRKECLIYLSTTKKMLVFSFLTTVPRHRHHHREPRPGGGDRGGGELGGVQRTVQARASNEGPH